ncbi:acyltransferase [Escherichia coli]|nr:acyltransferase [Escherichia coli]
MLYITELIFVVSVITAGLLAVKAVDTITPIKLVEHGRNYQIDGIRGFLALFVFIHHSVIWKKYLSTGIWMNPDSNTFTNIGQVGVTIFFMITGFLFFSKIRKGNQDWLRLYVSRVLRITPMFMISLVLILLVVGIKTEWKLNVPISDVIISIARWVPFTFGGMPNINGLHDTFAINAAVTWTLIFEWLFYLSLPVLSLILNKKVSLFPLLIGITGFILLIIYPISKIHIISFAFGFLASYLHKNDFVIKISNHKITPILLLSLLIFELQYFNETYSIIPISLCGIIFIAISSGCDFYGVLNSKITRKLGEATYSIYIIHGVIIFCVINFTGIDFLRLSTFEYFSFMSALSFVIVSLSCITYKYIESPCIAMTAKVSKSILSVKDKIKQPA